RGRAHGLARLAGRLGGGLAPGRGSLGGAGEEGGSGRGEGGGVLELHDVWWDLVGRGPVHATYRARVRRGAPRGVHRPHARRGTRALRGRPLPRRCSPPLHARAGGGGHAGHGDAWTWPIWPSSICPIAWWAPAVDGVAETTTCWRSSCRASRCRPSRPSP